MERICIILLLNLCFFAKTLCYKYVSDDVPVWQKYKDVNYVWWKRIFFQVQGLLRVTQQQDHFVTTVIHSLIGMFIYTAFGYSDISFWAAILFSFNPINNQGSVWISGRGYALPALFLLITLTFPILAPLTLFCGMWFNVGFFIATVVPIFNPALTLFVLIYYIWYARKIKENIKIKASSEMFDEDKRIHWTKIILVIKTFGFYTTHALIPIKTTFYHSYMQSMAGSGKVKAYKLDRFYVLGSIYIALIFFKVFFTPWDLASYGLIWWCIGISPFLNAFRISQEIAERYAYTPLIGLMLALSVYLQPYPMVMIAFVAMYATKLWFWMDAFQDDYYLVEQSCLNSPDAWFVWHIRALKRWDVQSHKEAMILWTMAKMISPNEFKVLFNLATMLKIHHQDAEANAFMDEAARNIPKGQEAQSAEYIDNWKKGEMPVLI